MRDDDCFAFGGLRVEPSILGDNSLFVAAEPSHFKAHEVPPIARALYAAAGLPVPDLPDIADPAGVMSPVSPIALMSIAGMDDDEALAALRKFFAKVAESGTPEGRERAPQYLAAIDDEIATRSAQ